MTQTTWRDKKASHRNPLEMAVTSWHLNSNKADIERMEMAIEVYEDVLRECRECDEPGCTKEASCGWPTEGEYRRTCHDHYSR